jgi:lipopolysaccharide/colanic/teichoic acid biosynthesis glycosyltransferase
MLPNLQENSSRVYEIIQDEVPVVYGDDLSYLAQLIEPRTSFCYSCWHVIVNIIFGLVGLTILLLILPVMALVIYLDSPGPIFYSQERLGFKRKPFRIYKFRSMCTDAESEGQAIWAARHDTRITRVGRILRATHMDELPQVFNILRGEMSLIGPRPEREVYAYEMEKLDPFYRHRVAVKPGLTGWAQVKFGYGEGDHSELYKLQHDLYYIRHRSCLLDIIIILKTIVEVCRFHGR